LSSLEIKEFAKPKIIELALILRGLDIKFNQYEGLIINQFD
jgi:hypothetical protein